MSEDINSIVAERGSNYGDFRGQAELCQDLCNVFFSHKSGQVEYTKMQHEALHMIFHKLSRIANGNPNYKDSWVDIAGYAKLIYDTL
jgi:hypothetical protein